MDPQARLWQRVRGDFQPCILHGEEGSQHAKARVYAPRAGYDLWHFRSGGVRLVAEGARRSLPVPGLYITTPRQPVRLHIPADTAFRRIHFALRAGPRHFGRPTDRPSRMLVLEDGPQPAAADFLGVDLPFVVPAPLADRTARLVARWCQLWWQDGARRLRAHAELALWLCDLIDLLLDEPVVGADWAEDLRLRIQRHLAGGLTGAQLAELVGLSASQLNRRCREAFGCSTLGCIDSVRREVAEAGLRRDDADIQGVARRCGFRSAAAFSRWFRKSYGLTPSQWRAAT